MPIWRSQLFRAEGQARNIDGDVLDHAVKTADQLRRVSPALPPIFSLNHLAHLSGAPYGVLREAVERTNDPYRLFCIRKRPLPGEELRYRIISVPKEPLKRAQTFIDRQILASCSPDEASVAFVSGSSILEAARHHCGARWIIKLDIKSFFESITEQQVYQVFLELGYQPLIAFEMARLCTRVRNRGDLKGRWRVRSNQWTEIPAYSQRQQGYLPQGTPTSPRLSNLVVRSLDVDLRALAGDCGAIYTRYADDLTFSTKRTDFGRHDARILIGNVYAKIGRYGFSPHLSKTQIVSPGSRKIVLGLGVDTDRPRLTRDFKATMRRHLYFLTHPDVGPAMHAAAQGAGSVYALRNHIQGLLAFAKGIDRAYAEKQTTIFQTVRWP